MKHYDFFICYRRKDGAKYAKEIKDKLVEKNYKVFLDDHDYSVGSDHRKNGQQVLDQSGQLILIGTVGVFDSKEVLWEVRTFSRSRSFKRKKEIVGIDYCGEIMPEGRDYLHALYEYLPKSLLYKDATKPEYAFVNSNFIEDITKNYKGVKVRFRDKITASFVIFSLFIVCIRGMGEKPSPLGEDF